MRFAGALARPAPRSFTAAFAVALLIAAIAPGPARSHVVSDRGVKLLREISRAVIAAAAAAPDSSGCVAPNRAGMWNHVEHQGRGLTLLMDACARGDSTTAERAWTAVETAFAHQKPDGDFETAAPESRQERLSNAAWWIAQLCRTEVVVVNSPLQKRFRWRVNLMLPKLRRSVDALVAAGDELLALHHSRPDRLMVDAAAFLLADGIYHEPRMAELGQRALVAALGGQHKTGAFGAREIGGEGRALAALIEIATYFPMPTLDRAAEHSASWLAGNGTVLRGMAPAQAREMMLALAVQAGRSGDPGLRSAAEKLAAPLETRTIRR